GNHNSGSVISFVGQSQYICRNQLCYHFCFQTLWQLLQLQHGSNEMKDKELSLQLVTWCIPTYCIIQHPERCFYPYFRDTDLESEKLNDGIKLWQEEAGFLERSSETSTAYKEVLDKHD
ncbi:hypothetical protein H1C71_036804, partial [Ictidomys tridecemlineatus]